MGSDIRWTNKSVLAFAEGRDPVERMEEQARTTVMDAMDNGWKGPPFDPVSLAKILNLSVRPRPDIPDARTVSTPDGLSIEFNPLRPRGRVRFSVAHEIAHTFFPDCTEQVRHRGSSHSQQTAAPDDWQLEVLCNIGAAELLMPTGSFLELAFSDLDIHMLVAARKEHDVSMEALLLRTVKLAGVPCAAFCASFDQPEGRYRLDYLIPSRSWRLGLKAGMVLPEKTIVADVNAIGYTASSASTPERKESWGKHDVYVQAVGLAPYPGSLIPRVVGILMPPDTKAAKQPDIELITADALEPRGSGKRIIAHIVPDSTLTWGGGGFAAQLRKKYPQVAEEFKAAATKFGHGLVVGQCYKVKISANLFVFNMVAQRSHGNDPAKRIRYSSLTSCLRELHAWAREIGASVHMPKIGTGHGGGSWDVIHELILEELVRKGTPVTVYQLP